MSLEDHRSSQEVGTDLEQPVEVSTLASQESSTESEQPVEVSTPAPQDSRPESEEPVDASALASGTPESSEMSSLLEGMETLSASPLSPGRGCAREGPEGRGRRGRRRPRFEDGSHRPYFRIPEQ